LANPAQWGGPCIGGVLHPDDEPEVLVFCPDWAAGEFGYG
jgi:hypothetical protein